MANTNMPGLEFPEVVKKKWAVMRDTPTKQPHPDNSKKLASF
jgi:hypothetical protein